MGKAKWQTFYIAALIVLGVILLIPLEGGRGLEPQEKWAARYDGPTGDEDMANAIAVDAKGNVYVTGYTGYWSGYWHLRGKPIPPEGGNLDWATVKYSANGKQLWAAAYNDRFNGDDDPSAIAVDGSGNVYVTGYSQGAGRDYLTIKYSANGKELWTQRYKGLSQQSIDYATDIAVDANGNVYVTGCSDPDDYATIKYDADGNQLWIARFVGAIKQGQWADSIATAMALDGAGNVYVTGYSARMSRDYVYATIKYDPDGKELWVSRYKSPYAGDSYAQDIAVDGSGNVYVTGESIADGAFNNLATVKIDPNGKQLWVQTFRGPQKKLSDVYWNRTGFIAVDNAGYATVAGTTQRPGKSCDFIVIRYDPNGRELWTQRYDGPAQAEDRPGGLAADGKGNVYVAGRSAGVGSDLDYATIMCDKTGRLLWTKRHNGPGNDRDSARAIALDKAGHVYVTGGSRSTSDYYSFDFLTIKY